MKKFRTLTLILCIAALVLSLTGCAMTPEKMIEKISEAYAGKTLTGFDMDMTADMDMEVLGETADFVGEFDCTTQYDLNDSGQCHNMYMEMDYKVSMSDQTLRDGMQIYIESNGDQQTTFVHMDSADVWSRTDTPAISSEGSAEDQAAFGSIFHSLDLSTLTVAEETQQLSGTVAYVVSGTITGAYLQEMLEAELTKMGDDLDAMLAEAGLEDFEMNALDFSALEIPFTVYVDSETFEIVQAELAINNFDSVMDGLIDSIMALLPEGTVMDDSVFSMDFNELSLVINNFQLDGTEVPKVPEEGRIRATQESFNPDLGDGTYVIQESGDAVKITAAEDWNVSDMGYWYVYFVNAKDTQTANFEIFIDATADDILTTIEDSILPEVQATGYYWGGGAGDPIGEFSTYDINYAGCHLYFAWKPVGDAMLLVSVVDIVNTNMTTALTPILESIELYEVQY